MEEVQREKIQAETRIESLTDEKAKLKSECEQLDLDYNDLDKEIQKRMDLLEKSLVEIETILEPPEHKEEEPVQPSKERISLTESSPDLNDVPW